MLKNRSFLKSDRPAKVLHKFWTGMLNELCAGTIYKRGQYGYSQFILANYSLLKRKLRQGHIIFL
jgi:hypothetical protein